MNLFSPKGRISRPITDRVKESLFNVLRKYDLPAGAIVADIFSGVGSLGIESLSRDAAFATFVEGDADVIAVLRKNIEKAGFTSQSRVMRLDAFEAGAPVDPANGPYTLAFVDPPYAASRQTDNTSPIGGLLAKLSSQVRPGGYVVVRTEEDVTLLARYDKLAATERRQWGTMAVTIFRREKDDEQAGGNKDNQATAG